MAMKNRFFILFISCLSVLWSNGMIDATAPELTSIISHQKQKELNRKLFFATVRNDCQDFAQLLKHGAQINARDRQGRTVLHIAASCGFIEIIRLALCAGADVNALNKWGNTPLHRAIVYKKTEVVQLLIMAGTDVTHKGEGDRSVRDLACRSIKSVIDQAIALVQEKKKLMKLTVVEQLDESDIAVIPQSVRDTILLGYLEEDIQERVRDAL